MLQQSANIKNYSDYKIGRVSKSQVRHSKLCLQDILIINCNTSYEVISSREKNSRPQARYHFQNW